MMKKTMSGFTMIEMAVVLVMALVVMVAGLSCGPDKQSASTPVALEPVPEAPAEQRQPVAQMPPANGSTAEDVKPVVDDGPNWGRQ